MVVKNIIRTGGEGLGGGGGGVIFNRIQEGVRNNKQDSKKVQQCPKINSFDSITKPVCAFIVSTFEENGIIMPSVIFSIQSTFGAQNNISEQLNLMPHWRYWFFEINLRL